MMKRMILAATLTLSTLPPLAHADQAALPRLNLAQEAALRCSAAFGLVAHDQQRAAPDIDAHPQLGTRGREFFVRTTARLMDETGASREVIAALLKQRVEDLQRLPGNGQDAKAALGGVVCACLPLLDAEVPAARTP